MAKVSEVKKAISTLGTAKKAVASVIGDIANIGFMPLEAELERQLKIAETNEAYANLSPDELIAQLEKEKEESTQKLIDEANEQLAKLMEARKNKPKEVEQPDEGEANPNRKDDLQEAPELPVS